MQSQHMKDHLAGSESEVILPQMVIEMLYELTGGEAILTTGVGQHQMWAGQYYQYEQPGNCSPAPGLVRWALATRRRWAPRSRGRTSR
ncbi:MAG: hypothetical protein CM1200mP29_08750 [Verrucomicrobiota bacterium]|nr:MAG: hypothetical protein CM1200mP29_08750 [Verrucomicrobiota bacterium]